MRISERNALTPAQREKYDRQLAFVLEHRNEVPKLAAQTIKRVSVSSASVYSVLSGNMFSTKIISALYSIVTEHLGISNLVGETYAAYGMNVPNEEDRIMLEKLVSARELRSAVSDTRISLDLAIRSYERATLSAQLADAEISTRYRLTARKLSPDTMTAVHEYISATPSALVPTETIIPVDISDRTAILAAATDESASLTALTSESLSTAPVPPSGDYYDEVRKVWCASDGTPLEPTGRDKYPDV